MREPAVNRRSFVLLGAAAAAAGAGVPMASAATPTAAPTGAPIPVRIVDDKATSATRALFAYLTRQQGRGILFGHQHALSYGFTFTAQDGESSDTRAAVGDQPALFGWDTLILDGDERPGRQDASEAENTAALSRCIRQADALGGINTLSAHMPNFVTGDDFYDTSGRVVSQILPGGAKHRQYDAFLDRVAEAVTGARRPDGTLIPVVFRPFHENNGGWFWWGSGHTTSAEYIEIFRYTVEYLRDTKGVRNLLYSYSPNSGFGGDPAGYLRTYPGDGYVDVLGYDAYDNSAGSDAWLRSLVEDLAMVVRLAEEKGKVPAYTEFGESGEEGRDPRWFTKLLDAVKADPLARRVTYLQTWANFGGDTRQYVPVPGHVLHADFVQFARDPYTVFAGDLRGVYAARTRAERNDPFLHLVTPTDRQRLTSAEATVRVRVTQAPAARVTFSVDGGPDQRLRLDADGFHSGDWSIDPAWLDNRSVTLSVEARANGRTLTDSALVLLGAVASRPAGWIDDFEGYAGDDATLTEAYSHINANTTTLSADHKASGAYGLAYAYDFSSAGYTGIGKTVDADWTAFSSLVLWLRGDGSGNGATLQIVSRGAYFEYDLPLSDATGREIRAPFSEFRPAPWDTAHAGEVLDAGYLAEVTTFNLYLGHGSGAPVTGVVYVDDIRAD
ncbi:glycosyl hydrolase [Streptomyces sp. NPDC006997]|uniref:glycosyl hydrolase n=1 Tax=Streptomyces sp. NPDC006997 TaxID=3155356 RepID=UPI003400C334